MSESQQRAVMTDEDLYDAMERGEDLFVHVKSGRLYAIDPAQRSVLKPFGQKPPVLVVGFPDKPHPRQRGCRWRWLSPASLARGEQR